MKDWFGSSIPKPQIFRDLSFQSRHRSVPRWRSTFEVACWILASTREDTSFPCPESTVRARHVLEPFCGLAFFSDSTPEKLRWLFVAARLLRGEVRLFEPACRAVETLALGSKRSLQSILRNCYPATVGDDRRVILLEFDGLAMFSC